MLNLNTNKISPEGGLKKREAEDMGMKENLLKEMSLSEILKVETSANTGADPMTSMHMRNFMECVRSRKTPNAPAKVGYNHSIATQMTTYALHTGKRVTFDDTKQDIVLS
jgi:hypothetical protein